MINLSISKLSLCEAEPASTYSSTTVIQQKPCTSNTWQAGSILFIPGTVEERPHYINDPGQNKPPMAARRSSFKVRGLPSCVVDQKLMPSCQSAERTSRSATPCRNVRFSSPISEVQIIPSRDEPDVIPNVPSSINDDISGTLKYQHPQLLPASLPPNSSSVSTIHNSFPSGITRAGWEPSTWLQRSPWQNWPVQEPINKATLQNNLRHVWRQFRPSEPQPKFWTPNPQAITSGDILETGPAITSEIHGKTPSLALEARSVERGLLDEGENPKSDAMGDTHSPMEVATKVSRKTMGVVGPAHVRGREEIILTVKPHPQPRVSACGRDHPSLPESGVTAERLTPTHPPVPFNYRPPLVTAEPPPVNGAKRKAVADTHDTRPTKRPRVKSEHEMRLNANFWANELKACDYLGKRSGHIDQQTLHRLASIVNKIDNEKELWTTHLALLSPQETNVIGLLQGLKKCNSLEKHSPIRLKAKEIVAYWREEFREVSQQRHDGRSSEREVGR
jgi:hypothetical protein